MTRSGTRYSQIADYYSRLIDGKILKDGAKMPTESQVCELFQVSRITVRQAMSELAQAGYIERVQGKGSFVKVQKTNMQLNHLQGFSEEMKAKGKTPSTQPISLEVTPCDRDVATRLELEEDARVTSICRLRLADGEPVAVEHVFIPFYLCPQLAQWDGRGSLYHQLAEYGLKVCRATQDISAGFTPRGVCDLLNIPPRTPTLQIERVTYLENNTPLEFVRSVYRSDRYTFHVEMSR